MKNIHAERAVDYYGRNFNCTQGVFTTYAIEHGLDEKLALKLATNFGGGARKGEMCGAVSGALMVLGLLYGHSESDDLDAKAKAYAMAEEYMNRFIKKNGSVVAENCWGMISQSRRKRLLFLKRICFIRCARI